MFMFWRSAAQSLVASVALVSLCSICYRLHFNLATVALLLMIVVVVASRFFINLCLYHRGSLLSTHCSPGFLFRVDDPFDVVAVNAFFITSLIIARLVLTVRQQAEEALSSVSYRVIEAKSRNVAGSQAASRRHWSTFHLVDT